MLGVLLPVPVTDCVQPVPVGVPLTNRPFVRMLVLLVLYAMSSAADASRSGDGSWPLPAAEPVRERRERGDEARVMDRHYTGVACIIHGGS